MNIFIILCMLIKLNNSLYNQTKVDDFDFDFEIIETPVNEVDLNFDIIQSNVYYYDSRFNKTNKTYSIIDIFMAEI